MVGHTMGVCIDDMLVKSLRANQHISHMEQSFEVLKKYNMKLNRTKCSFGVSLGKFLGYLVTQRGIEANQDQIQSILRIPSPTCIKNVQKLIGKIAALSCFISKSSKRCHLFFNTLCKSKSFEWTRTCEEALNQFTRHLTSPPLPSKLKDGETLYIYLAASETTVSVVLIREEEGKQLQVYYVSRTLLDAETRYTELEKLAVTLVMAARKLRPYFQCRSIMVLTTFPLKNILHKLELADFMPNIHEQTEKKLLYMTKGPQLRMWTLHMDDSSNSKGKRLGIVLTSPDGDMLERWISCGFKAMNNEAEYEVMIVGLNVAKEMGVQRLTIYSDSQLVINQMQGHYQARDNKMTAYVDIVKKLTASFHECIAR